MKNQKTVAEIGNFRKITKNTKCRPIVPRFEYVSGKEPTKKICKGCVRFAFGLPSAPLQTGGGFFFRSSPERHLRSRRDFFLACVALRLNIWADHRQYFSVFKLMYFWISNFDRIEAVIGGTDHLWSFAKFLYISGYLAVLATKSYDECISKMRYCIVPTDFSIRISKFHSLYLIHK